MFGCCLALAKGRSGKPQPWRRDGHCSNSPERDSDTDHDGAPDRVCRTGEQTVIQSRLNVLLMLWFLCYAKAMGKDAAVSTSKAKQPLTSQKSMYTPVFYTPSQTNAIAGSSTEGKSSMKGKGKEREKVTIPNLSSANLKRLEALSKRHIALNQVSVEVPDSRSNSEVSVEEESGKGNLPEDDLVKQDLEGGIEAKVARNARIRHLRTQIAAARKASGFNPAHGKWELVTRLVRLGVTSGGRRWVGARADLPPVDIIGKGELNKNKSGGAALGWCNAETEEEWFEWERRFEHEMALKRRVAEWSKGVQPVAPGGGVEEEEEDSDTAVAAEEDVPLPVSAPAPEPEPEPEPPVQATTVKRKRPLQSSGNALGFSMSKRTATASALRANGKPSGSGKRISNVTDLVRLIVQPPFPLSELQCSLCLLHPSPNPRSSPPPRSQGLQWPKCRLAERDREHEHPYRKMPQRTITRAIPRLRLPFDELMARDPSHPSHLQRLGTLRNPLPCTPCDLLSRLLL